MFRHPDPSTVTPPAGSVVERLSFRHLDDDPVCTGSQLVDNAERVA